MKELINKHIKGDRVIWVVVLLISLFSLLIVYSSTSMLAYKSKNLDGNTEFLIFRHFIFLVAGFSIMIFIHKQKLNVISKLSQLAVIGSVVLLLMTLVLGWGGSASRWLFGFQPSDIAKISLIVYLARQLSQNKEELKDFKVLIKKVMVPIGVICALILPADLSTAVMLFVVCFTMVFVANIPLKHLGSIMGMAILAFGFILVLGLAFPKLLPRVGTWNSRIEAFWKGDQATDAANKNHQSNIAKAGIARGGFKGVGPSNSSVKSILHSAWADFIFAVFIEEYGSGLGGITIILLYLIILFRVIKIAMKSNSNFGKYLAFGLGFSIVFQAFLNMGVSVNVLPVTGQPLPMISMGGTAILLTSLAFGIILSVSAAEKETKKKGGNYAV